MSPGIRDLVELLLIALGCAVAGVAIGRWIGLLVPAVIWTVIATFLLLNNGWHGAGWGDFGIAWNVFAAILSVVATAAGIRLRHTVQRPQQTTD
jgi:hypothetical protein